MKTIIEFGKIAYSNANRKSNLLTIEIELKLVQNNNKLNYLNLEPIKEYYQLSISGNIWNANKTDIICGGQCLDEMKIHLKDNKLFNELFELWTNYHLNDLQAGTFEQTEYLKQYYIGTSYNEKTTILDAMGLNEPYKYGSSWLVEEIPLNVVDKIKEIIQSNIPS